MARLHFSLVVFLVMATGCFAFHPMRLSGRSSPTKTSSSDGPEACVQWNKGCQCGKKPASRIVGGQEADINEYPWMAALMRTNGDHFCGGTLINDRYVLTAAHCCKGVRAGDINVNLGDHDHSTDSETDHVTHQVVKIIMHKGYNDRTYENDICILKLRTPVKVGSTMLPVCLPTPKSTYTNHNATVTGWGTSSSGGTAPTKLHEVNVTVISNSDCNESYEDIEITEDMLCASAEGKDTCLGDSGGPLTIQDGDGKTDLIGLVSWGRDCAHPDYPGVYNRVNNFMDWVRDNTKDGVYCTGMKLSC